MTLRQNLLRLVYPVWMVLNKIIGRRAKVLTNSARLQPPQSFYDLSVQLNNGEVLKLDSLRGKKILLVNTASDCGFTNQYHDLQRLSEEKTKELVVIGFPANDFKEQEKGDDKQIAEFCKINFGVSFPLSVKSSVTRGPQQNKIFSWLTDKTKNGWTNKQPSWNFSKWLVNRQGILTHYFDPSISPLSEEVRKAIEQT